MPSYVVTLQCIIVINKQPHFSCIQRWELSVLIAELTLLNGIYNLGLNTDCPWQVPGGECCSRKPNRLNHIQVGNFRIDPRFHPTLVGWNLGLTGIFHLYIFTLQIGTL